MLPNVLLIVSMSFFRHDFYYLCNLPFQLVSVLVILILEFHICPPFLFYNGSHSTNTLALSIDSCFMDIFSYQFYRKHLSAFVMLNMCCDCVILRLPHPTDLLYQFFPCIISALIPEMHLTGK